MQPACKPGGVPSNSGGGGLSGCGGSIWVGGFLLGLDGFHLGLVDSIWVQEVQSGSGGSVWVHGGSVWVRFLSRSRG